ncbi:MAG: hypothetical protein KF708_19410 [Pirellulales bacterium]|nr:hypothetical protein [Pirellulales bacterium]
MSLKLRRSYQLGVLVRMRLDYVLLASSAEAATRNRVHILGANISVWTAISFPTDASFCLVAKLDFRVEEFDRTYDYRVEISGPGDAAWQPLTQDRQFTVPRRQDRPDLGTSMTIMAHVHARLSEAGDYRVRLIVDDIEVAERTLIASLPTEVTSP